MTRQKKRVFFETEEVVKKTKRGYIDLDTDYFQFYHIAFQHLASLTGTCSKDFVLWVMARVDENNEFIYNKAMFNEFLEDLGKIKKPKKYSENTLHISIRELVDAEILIHNSRGRYKVNPNLFWNDEMAKRIKSVKETHTNKILVEQGTVGTPLEYPDEPKPNEHESENESSGDTLSVSTRIENTVGFPGS